MPELPEVQTTVNGLRLLVNKKITKIKLYSTKLRYKIPKNLKKIANNYKFIKIYRKGKYIIINMNNNYSMIFHLGMSGRLKIQKINEYQYLKHDHILIYFNTKILIYNDPRRFGFIDFTKTHLINKKNYLSLLGVDPFNKKFTFQYLSEKIKNSNVPIKQILLNQKIISGIGNIYASEILFDAKISPFINGNALDIDQIKGLIKSTRKILSKAILFGGTSIRNYVSTEGVIGSYQNNFKVYNKLDKKIMGFKIKRIIQYGRATYYCPEIQKSRKQ